MTSFETETESQPIARNPSLLARWMAKVGSSLANVLPSGTDAQILVNNTGSWNSVTMSGDTTIADTGAVTLKNTGTAGTYGDVNHTLTITTDAQGRTTAVTTNAIATSAATAVVLSTDSFNRPDNTSLGSTDGTGTRDPLTWTKGAFFGAGASTIQIVSNQIKGLGGKPVAYVDLGTADVVVQCSTPNVAQPGGLTARWSDTNNQYALYGNTGNWAFAKYQASVLTVLGTTAAVQTGDIIRITCAGQSILATVTRTNGTVVTLYSGTDSFNQSITTHGIAIYTTNGISDDWRATTLEYANPIGNAGGDLTGTYPNPTVAALRGHTVKNASPSDAQILVWNNSNTDWEPVTVGGDLALSNAGSATVEEAVATNNAATGSVTVDFSAARVHKLTMTGTVTSLTVNNAVNGRACGITLYMIQDGTGSRTVTTWTNFKWPSGTAPTLSTAASAVDIIVAESTDGGTTWYGNLAGKGYA